MAAYASSKAAVNGLVLPLAREFSKFGIRVQSIVPTMFSTVRLALFIDLDWSSLTRTDSVLE